MCKYCDSWLDGIDIVHLVHLSLTCFQLCSNVYSAAYFERRRRKVSMIQRRVAFAKNSGTQNRTIDPQTYLASRINITAENNCNEESLLETRVEESFLSGISFFIGVLFSYWQTLRSILCARFLCHRHRIF